MCSPRGTVASYRYNTWGKLLTATGTTASVHPIRYRGYYYDAETGLYYLQSRYYDPVVGRFINGDVYASTGQGILGANMFAYCGNDPVMSVDHNGTWPKWFDDALNWLKKAGEDVVDWLKNIFGAESTVEYTVTSEREILPDPLPITFKKGIATTWWYICLLRQDNTSLPLA